MGIDILQSVFSPGIPLNATLIQCQCLSSFSLDKMKIDCRFLWDQTTLPNRVSSATNATNLIHMHNYHTFALNRSDIQIWCPRLANCSTHAIITINASWLNATWPYWFTHVIIHLICGDSNHVEGRGIHPFIWPMALFPCVYWKEKCLHQFFFRLPSLSFFFLFISHYPLFFSPFPRLNKPMHTKWAPLQPI